MRQDDRTIYNKNIKIQIYVRWCNWVVGRGRSRNGNTPCFAPCSSRSRTRDYRQEKQQRIKSVPRWITCSDVRFQLSSCYLGSLSLSRRRTASPQDWSCHSETVEKGVSRGFDQSRFSSVNNVAKHGFRGFLYTFNEITNYLEKCTFSLI